MNPACSLLPSTDLPDTATGRGPCGCLRGSVGLVGSVSARLWLVPRARGRHRDECGPILRAGNNPACAGTTLPARRGGRAPREQPRVRGDDPSTRDRATYESGNNPACAGTTVSQSENGDEPREQPRVRGDDSGSASVPPTPMGTTPRARGRRDRVGCGRGGRGNNPACAGTTPWWASPPCAFWEQPRVRGDDRRGWPSPLRIRGTTPRARGRRVRVDRWLRGEGNNPACAGTTPRAACRARSPREQPRVRGDDRRQEPFLHPGDGTTPRARGRPSVSSSIRARIREQPRVRGDDSFHSRRASSNKGTTPRARGRLGHGRPAASANGNNPACAGTTPSCSRGRRCAREQPRVRGDDLVGWLNLIASRGTTPRARGRPRSARHVQRGTGNNPACAGTTSSTTAGPPNTGEQPRVRGDDQFADAVTATEEGTTPRARGRQLLTCGFR
ncbi:hypothetical protein ACVWXU_008432 [Streptomyces sp. TE33382]